MQILTMEVMGHKSFNFKVKIKRLMGETKGIVTHDHDLWQWADIFVKIKQETGRSEEGSAMVSYMY